MWHGFDVNSYIQHYRQYWSKLMQELHQIFNGDWITSVCTCISDCECSSRTSFTHMNNPYLYKKVYNYPFWCHCEWTSMKPLGPCGARGHCRISPPHFLAECRKRRLNQGSFVSAVCLVVVFFDLYCVYVRIFVIYTEYFPYCLFVSNGQVIGCEDRLRNDLYCVRWGVKLYSVQSSEAFGWKWL